MYDYELEFFVYSKGSMIIEDKEYNISKGDVVFRKPGQFTQGIMPYSCYLICFDLLDNTKKEPETYDFTKEQEFQNNYCNPVLDGIPPVFKPSNFLKYQELFDGVLKEFINPGDYSGILLKSSVLRIIYEICSDIKNPFVNTENINSAHYMAVKRATEYIEVNFKQKITLEKLALIANLSPTYFHKVFTDTLGITPTEYVTKVRIDKAKELLVKTNLPVYEIAFECGYENIPYFSYTFKNRINLAPSEFRKRYSYFM
ncbi:AraC family transcriptional regulator [Acetivibrio cellulolyticus]|uniref:AraC family transcriptional regulator n=1 Tax=Acetivibrio cellulolyticus TaxID=35830 RepID=UPI0001E304F8|nr:AraC family transcriptional regulator [Acetivibrio cellulolyticus]